MIRIDRLWSCTTQVDMRAGAGRLLAAVVNTLGGAHADLGCLFANVRSTRVNLPVPEGFGVRCAVLRLDDGRFESPHDAFTSAPLFLAHARFDALL